MVGVLAHIYLHEFFPKKVGDSILIFVVEDLMTNLLCEQATLNNHYVKEYTGSLKDIHLSCLLFDISL